ncbi:hypothetical protein Tco_1273505 [Tanacetum coccineum]
MERYEARSALNELCRQKELYCMHNNVEDLNESALNSKLLSINLNSQHLNKEKQEVKNIAEPTAKHQRTRLLQLIRVCRISKALFCMKKESDEFIKSSVEDLIPIPRESEDSPRSDTLLVQPLSDANEDECFDPGGVIDEIDAFLDMDISTDIETVIMIRREI